MESFQSLIICLSQTYHDRQVCLPSGGLQIKTSISRTKCKFAIKIWLQKKSLWVEISVISRCGAQRPGFLSVCVILVEHFSTFLKWWPALPLTSPINLWLLQHWFWFHSISFISGSNLYILNRGTYRYSFYQTRTYKYVYFPEVREVWRNQRRCVAQFPWYWE